MKDDVLLLDAAPWNHPLITPEDIALLSRSVLAAHEVFNFDAVSAQSLTAWRMFQAADKCYNGFVTTGELQRLIATVSPRLAHPDRGVIDSTDGGNTALVLWDILCWWREADLASHERKAVEHHVLNRLIVPSDGLWAGVSTNAILRIRKSVCRSSGHLFRYQAEHYLQSAFRTIDSQGGTGKLEIVLYLIRQVMDRLGRSALKIWKKFIDLDDDDDGLLDEDQLSLLLSSVDLKAVPTSDGPASRTTSCSSLDSEPAFALKPKFSLVQILEAIANDVKIEPLLLPGQQAAPTVTSKFQDFLKRLIPPPTKLSPPLRRLQKTPEITSSVLRTYIRAYLDVEQWRGQKWSELKSNQVETSI